MKNSPSSLIVSPNGEPDAQLRKAASEFLIAFIQQFPRAQLALKDGFTISIANKNGPLLQIAGVMDTFDPLGRKGIIGG